MDKLIKLGGREFKLTSSTFTIILYYSKFETDMFQDLTKLDNNNNYTEVVTILCRVLYAFAYPNLKGEPTFDEFVQELPLKLFTNENEILKLTEVISSLAVGEENSVPTE